MKCPKCGNEQADGWLSCQKCHIIFSRWQPAAATASRPPAAGTPASPPLQTEASEPPRPVRMFGDPLPPPPRPAAAAPAPPSPGPVGWPVYLVLILPFIAGLWWMLNPRGLAVEPGSYRDEQRHFAIRAPQGWLALTKENYDTIVRQYGAQLPGKLSQALNSQGMAVSFIRLGQAGEFAPSLNVVVVKGSPPPINEKSKQEAAKAIAEGFAALLTDYRQESVEIIEVDKIRSLEIVSTASMPFRLANEEDGATLVLRSRQVLVPGKNQAYILTFSESDDAVEDSAADFQGALDSFRVLKRPPRFGPVVNGGLIGGLLGGLLFMLNGFFRAMGAKRLS